MLWAVIEKEIIYNDENQRYDYSYDELNYEHLERFVLIQDKISKRTYEILQVTTKFMFDHHSNCRSDLLCLCVWEYLKKNSNMKKHIKTQFNLTPRIELVL